MIIPSDCGILIVNTWNEIMQHQDLLTYELAIYTVAILYAKPKYLQRELFCSSQRVQKPTFIIRFKVVIHI